MFVAPLHLQFCDPVSHFGETEVPDVIFSCLLLVHNLYACVLYCIEFEQKKQRNTQVIRVFAHLSVSLQVHGTEESSSKPRAE